MPSKNGSLPLWKELAMTNPRSDRSRENKRPSSVPAESRKEIRNYLVDVTKSWLISENKEKEAEKNNRGDEKDSEENEMSLPLFTRTEKGGHPAAWVGGGVSEEGSFEGVILCTELLCLPKPLYINSSKDEFWREALVPVNNEDVVLYVEGNLSKEGTGTSTQQGRYPSILDLKSVQVHACRVTCRQTATSSEEGGLEEVENPRRVFFRLLRNHPEVADGLSSMNCTGRNFVTEGEKSPNTRPCEGTIKNFFEDDGYGFIKTDETEEDVFFLEEDANGGTLRDAGSVRFDLAETVRRPRALNIEVLEKNGKEGIVEWFSERRGYGFITLPNEKSDDIFVHETEVNNGPLDEGDPVEFRTKIEDRGPKAVDVTKI